MAAELSVSKLRAILEKKYKDSSELFPDFTSIKQIDVIPMNSAIVNAVTGVGGFPRGRVTEVFGAESTGKTTFAISTGVALQHMNPKSTILYVDYEHAFDAAYAHALGLNIQDDNGFVFAQPEYFEQGCQIIDDFVMADAVDLIVIDSAAAMTPKAEMEGKMEELGGGRLGLHAALMSKFLSVMTKKIARPGRKPALIMINQTRTRIDLVNPRNTGEDSAAGKALKFYSSIRMKLEEVKYEGESNRDAKKATDQLYTQKRIRVTAVKNKVAPPFIRGTLVIEFGKGINNVVSVAELAETKLGIMSGSGYFKYVGDTDETNLTCRGREDFLDEIQRRPALLLELERKVLDAIRAEHAKTLGLTAVISVKGKAKEVETITPNQVMRLSMDKDEEPSDSTEYNPPSRGPVTTTDSMPVEEDSDI